MTGNEGVKSFASTPIIDRAFVYSCLLSVIERTNTRQ